MFGLSRLVSTVLMCVVAAALIFGFLWLQGCQQARQKAAEARVERSQAGAAQDSAKDAVATVRASGEAERRSEELTRTNEQEIRNAKGADAVVDPAVRDAGFASLCRRSAYSDSERCRVFKPAAR